MSVGIDGDGSGAGRVFRFAPSPNGHLHLGHALSALLNHGLAAAQGGTLLLRLEDIDRERCREAYAAAILEDLRWIGVDWSGTPLRQSDRFEAYRGALDGLTARGLLYPCFCSRGAILSAASADGLPPRTDPDGAPLYPGTCRRLTTAERARRLTEGRPAGLRLDMARALAETGARDLTWRDDGDAAPGREAGRAIPAEPALWGDALLARRDIATSYHLSVVVDDADQGITDVVRGCDLFQATGLHRLLQALLGLPTPRYRHHRLVVDAEGHKLSKSRRAPALRDLRRDGLGPADIRRLVGLG